MGTLWNVDNTGNLTTGTIATRTLTNIQQSVLPVTYTTSNSITAAVNNEYIIFSSTNWNLTMPSSSAAGDKLVITTESAGGTIHIPALNLVVASHHASTVAGTITTTDEPATICLERSGTLATWDVTGVTGNWLCSGSPSNFYINGMWGGTVPCPIATTDVTPSTTITNGSIIAGGGVGVSGNVNAKGLGLFLQSNGSIGTATMSGGSVLVLNTGISANSYPVAISQDSGVTGALRIVSKTVGVGFTITSSNAGDAGQVFWFILNQV